MYLAISFFILVILVLLLNFTNIGHRESCVSSVIDNKKYLPGGEPFKSVKFSKKAILFIHGFPGSPKMYYLVRELAIKDGYDVFIPTLPGFGTNHENMLKSNFSMWFNYIDEYYKKERSNYEKFYVVGNSMGGALTLKIAEKYSGTPLAPTGLATVAAPVFINKISSKFIRLVSFFKSYIPPKRAEVDRSKDQDGETEWVGYRGIFPKQIYSLLLGLKIIKRDLNKITVPCYFCHGREDKTVSFDNLDYICSRVSSSNILVRRLRMKGWKHTNHSLFIYKSYYKQVWNDINYFFTNID